MPSANPLSAQRTFGSNALTEGDGCVNISWQWWLMIGWDLCCCHHMWIIRYMCESQFSCSHWITILHFKMTIFTCIYLIFKRLASFWAIDDLINNPLWSGAKWARRRSDTCCASVDIFLIVNELMERVKSSMMNKMSALSAFRRFLSAVIPFFLWCFFFKYFARE